MPKGVAMTGANTSALSIAVVAGLISLLGLVIGKEQKVSEFRQAWINDLRRCLISYLANINAIADAIRISQQEGGKKSELVEKYKELNEAHHGIKLRLNDTELLSANLLNSMDAFDKLATKNDNLTPEKIELAEECFLKSSKALLKDEWNVVKRGEAVYFWTKHIVIVATLIFSAMFIYLSIGYNDGGRSSSKKLGNEGQSMIVTSYETVDANEASNADCIASSGKPEGQSKP